MLPNYVPAEKINLAKLGAFDEKWVEDIIKREASENILGLGHLKNFGSQITHHHAGRMDLVADGEDGEKFVIELMLGELDASHLTRVMEYFLREKQRNSDVEADWFAVLIAENIQKSRYFPLLQFLAQKLSNEIPIIAIEMTALKVGNATTLHFSTVVDSRTYETEPAKNNVPATREAWAQRMSEANMRIVDEVGVLLKEVNRNLSQRFNSGFIGTVLGVRAHNFVTLRPRKKSILVRVLIADTEIWSQKLSSSGLQVVSAADQKIRFSLHEEDIAKARELLKGLFQASFNEKFGSEDDESENDS